MRNLISALVALLLSLTLHAQENDVAQQKKSAFADSLWSIYQSARGENLSVFQGRQIMSGYPGIGGSPFYPHPDWVVGDVKYEGYWYYGVDVLYDTYRDELLVRHPNGIPFVLFSDRVQAFSMKNFHFVRFDTDKGPIKTGFYEVLSDGNLKIYVKRVATLHEEIVDQTIIRNFEKKPRYYAQLGNEIVSITKQGQLMDLAKAKRGQVQQAVKASGLKFRKNQEAVIKIIADTYNQSKP